VAKLKVVTDGDAALAAPKTLKDAVDVSERALLVTIRAKIASEIDGGVPPHTLAPLTRQLRDIDREIRALDLREQEAGEDDDAPDEAFDAEAL
jgi:hypothetical protein